MLIIIMVIAIFLIICVFNTFLRTLITNPFKTIYYAVVDGVKYFTEHRYDNMQTGRLICYTALFGGGKTLSCVHYVKSLYNRYNDKKVYDVQRKKFVTQKVHIISNVDLIGVPYEHFESLSQIVRVSERFKQIDEENDTLTCTIVLGDEFSVQMNSRNFKSNIDALFLNTLLTCRHHHIMLVYNAQRFNHVDALLRQVTTYVVQCRKVWRVVVQDTYDAYTLENCSDPTTVKSIGSNGWFVSDRDYESYDTLATVGNLRRSVEMGDMDSEIEIINRQASNVKDIGYFRKMRQAFKKR